MLMSSLIVVSDVERLFTHFIYDWVRIKKESINANTKKQRVTKKYHFIDSRYFCFGECDGLNPDV